MDTKNARIWLLEQIVKHFPINLNENFLQYFPANTSNCYKKQLKLSKLRMHAS